MSATITFLLLFSSSLFTCVAPSPTTTTLLDVSSSLQQTIHILSIESQTVASTAFNSSAQFSLPLFSREFILKTQHKDYKSLFLSRLERDSSRVNSLIAKLQRSQTEDLSTPVVSGASLGSGEYFSRIGIGSPPKQFYMVLDTGSDVNWLQCQPCASCYNQVGPIYDPVASSSYRSLSCDSRQCTSLDLSACRSSKCRYKVSYVDGSFTEGDFVTETVSFGNSGSIQNVAIGCGHDNEGLFVGSAGLLGLGGGSLSLPNQIKATSFSYCLVDRNSFDLGSLEFNSPLTSDSVTAPIFKSRKMDTYYYVGLTGFSVGGQKVPIPTSIFQLDSSGNGGIILDSGTSVTRLQTQAYDLLRDSFRRHTANLKITSSFALFDTCYDFSGMSSVTIPTVSFNLAGGKSLPLSPKNYLVPVDSTGTFCFAFAPTSSSFGIIGNIQQQQTRVTYDLANNVVGLSRSRC